MAFPDNWTIGMSFYAQRLRARAQRSSSTRSARRPRRTPDADSRAARSRPTRRRSIRYRDVTRRRAVRGRAAGRGGGDRQDPHHRMDAAAALRRAALRGDERQLERPAREGTTAVPRRSSRSSCKGFGESTRTIAKARHQLGIRCSPRGPGHLRTRQARSANIRNPDDVNGGVNHSARHSIFPRSSSRSTGCIRWCRT